jgi:DNA invertase Pin-like site-specific DNA recombinase
MATKKHDQHPKAIAYYRVSTAKQGRSGLGLEDQKKKVADYIASTSAKLLAPPYVEVETATKLSLENRPELAKAIAHAKRAKAVLVIAVLDRLGRNVAFVSGLMECGVDFVCADAPNDDKFVLHMKASMAEEEGRKISLRTKDALAAAKARGTKLGSAGAKNLTREGTLRGSAAGVAAIRAAKAEAYSFVAPVVADIKAQNPDMSLRAIAKALNEMGETTRNGSAWTAVQVSRVLASLA